MEETMASSEDKGRLDARFKQVFGTTEHPLYAQLAGQIDQRGIQNVLQDVNEAGRHRQQQMQQSGGSSKRENTSL
jgi:hypothetical protein